MSGWECSQKHNGRTERRNIKETSNWVRWCSVSSVSGDGLLGGWHCYSGPGRGEETEHWERDWRCDGSWDKGASGGAGPGL